MGALSVPLHITCSTARVLQFSLISLIKQNLPEEAALCNAMNEIVSPSIFSRSKILAECTRTARVGLMLDGASDRRLHARVVAGNEVGVFLTNAVRRSLFWSRVPEGGILTRKDNVNQAVLV